MRVTTWTEYSLIIALHLARRHGSGSGPVAARELAEREGLPIDYVEQILLRLRRGGLVDSVRGARGGYTLARHPDDISIHDLMSASEHQTFELNCDRHPISHERCDPAAGCAIRPVWLELQSRIEGFLSSVSLGDLMASAESSPELVTLTVNS